MDIFAIKYKFEKNLNLTGSLGAYNTIVKPSDIYRAAKLFNKKQLQELSEWYKQRLNNHNNPAMLLVNIVLADYVITKK